MAMKAGGGSDDLNSEINVTPLVDVMLVLLIIFMITAPMLNTGVELTLPQVTAQQLEDPKGKLVLSITKDRRLLLGTTEITWKDLPAKLKNEVIQQDGAIHIQADGSLPYAVVVTVMAIAKDAGIPKVLLLTDPTDNLKLDELERAAQAPR
ncbi:MAG TPA: biopolymer transporter ExbD [Kofleriaceae bacterium]|nr:biopolymer transporter ExbD [Kofleriaceae bacterium]